MSAMTSLHQLNSNESLLEMDKSFTELSNAFILLLRRQNEEKRAAYKLRKKQKRSAEPRSPTKLEMNAPMTSLLNSGNCSPEPSLFPSNFSNAVRRYPPPTPPGLIKGLAKRKSTGGKVKVLLRISPSFPGETSSFLKVDQKKKQVTLYDPTAISHVSQKYKRMGVAAPKMFVFDSIFEPDSSQAEICSTALTDVLQAVVNGSDGCVFAYGHSGLGKTFSMVGRDENVHSLGIAACSIAWLFRLIDEKREKTGARFSIRVSAVEVVGRSENLKDLLQDQSKADSNDTTNGTKPSVYLYDDPVSGPQLLNHSELRASTPEKAAFYLDAALAARTIPNNEKDTEETLNSHMFFTIHVYQSRVDKIAGKMGVHGGRSRLHLIDLASCERYNSSKKEISCCSMSLNGLGNVIIALINGAKHVPHKDSTLTRLLRESLGSTTCRATMVGHISPSIPFYTESLACVQFAARIHRLRRKKGGKGSSTSSSGGESSCDEMRMRKPRIRTSALTEPLREESNNMSEDYTSSTGEESCDTVIYCGPDGEISDRDLTDNEGPSHMNKVTVGPKGIEVDANLRSKLNTIEEKSPEGSRCPSMELEYDLSEEFKGNIEKVPEKGSVENLTLKKKKKKANSENCEFWEDPLSKVGRVRTPEPVEEPLLDVAEQETVCTVGSDAEPDGTECDVNTTITGFIPITDTLENDSSNDVIEEELSHSPALDTPLSTFYHIVPVSDSDEKEKAIEKSVDRHQHHSPKTTPNSPPSPTSKEVRSILENYVVDQMLIKNSHQQPNQSHFDTTDEASEGLVPPLTPQKTCVAGTAQISATSPKRMKRSRPRSKEATSSNRKCLSDAGDNRSDTRSEDSYGSTKTDPLHYVKTPRRGVKPCHASSSGSLPREYKVIIRDKTACVHYVGCEMDNGGGDNNGARGSPCKTATVQLRYCGSEQDNENENTDLVSSPKSPDSQRKATPLTITSRASFAFNQSTLKKPKIDNEPIKTGEPYGPHEVMSRNSKEKLCAKSEGEVDIHPEMNSDAPRRKGVCLNVPVRQRSKFKASRIRDSGQGYSSGIASDGSITDSPSSKSPARRRRRLGSEVSSSGYESMRDGTTSHVSGSDSADEKGVLVDRSNSGNQRATSGRENNSGDFERLRLRGIDEMKETPSSLLDIHKWRVIKLRTKQVELKRELDQAKSRLLLDGTRWSFYLESANMDPEDSNLVQVLEKENKRLEKRIKVCKSRIMLVTSFDILPQRSKL
ncbi:kinesin-like protein KIF26A isoform X2 [Dendronephthya gigantea]|uniref:kinesin-like protein KIF26A isoform X2 n=1 Tax=Dendronephthya gigantea TaxID=151771 RepID=UPI00106C63E5|nr:kinesin-like protein KIF26A isoform X2 [Dendronephthya gigantea]